MTFIEMVKKILPAVSELHFNYIEVVQSLAFTLK